jgi:hypothetical protein
MDITQLIDMIEKGRWTVQAELQKLNANGEKFRYISFKGSGLRGDGFPVVTSEYDTVRYGLLHNFTWGSAEGSEFTSDGAKWVVLAQRCYRGSAEYPGEVRFLAMKIDDDVTMDDEAKSLVKQASRLMFSDPARAQEWAHKTIMMMYEMRK